MQMQVPVPGTIVSTKQPRVAIIPEHEFVSLHSQTDSSIHSFRLECKEKLPQWGALSMRHVSPVNLGLLDTVAALKRAIWTETGIPQSCLKLSTGGIHLKNDWTLARHNIIPGSVIEVRTHKRGGRMRN